jgi:hypothetical protein
VLRIAVDEEAVVYRVSIRVSDVEDGDEVERQGGRFMNCV